MYASSPGTNNSEIKGRQTAESFLRWRAANEGRVQRGLQGILGWQSDNSLLFLGTLVVMHKESTGNALVVIFEWNDRHLVGKRDMNGQVSLQDFAHIKPRSGLEGEESDS